MSTRLVGITATVIDASIMSDCSNPPFYVLLAHSSLSGLPSGALSNTLGHPVIQYHYADDSPLSLLPAHPDEHVLVFDHSANPTIQSISKGLSVTGLKLEEAPGAAAENETGTRNSTMYIIETTSNDQYVIISIPNHYKPHLIRRSMSASYGDRKSAHNVLALYRNRYYMYCIPMH